MSLSITKRPALVTAALVPVVYRMQRKDQAFNTITNNGGTIRITVNSVNVTANYTVGDTVYVKSDDSKYDAIGLVTARAFSTNTTIDVNIAYTANATTGFVNNNTKRPLYQVLVNIYRSATNTLLFTKGFVYTADSKGSVIADVEFLKQVLSPEITSIGSYGVSIQDTKKFIDYYIGTTEQWFGSANSETLDNANVRTSIFGILTIGGNNDLPFRVPSKLLSISSKLRAFIGKYFDLSYYGLTTSHTVSIEHYASTGALTATDTDVVPTTGICRVPILPLSTDRKILAKLYGQLVILAGTLWSDVGGLLAFTKATSTLSANMTSNQNYRAEQPTTGIDLTNFSPIVLSVQITGTWTGTVSVVVFVDDAYQNYRLGSATNLTANGTYPITIQPSSSAGSSLGTIGKMSITATSGSGNTGTAAVVITIPNGQIIKVPVSTQEIEVQDACVKPITLSWTNRLGGQDWWTFLFRQEINYDYSGDKKTRRIALHARDLSYDQWQMLNGMNSVGDVYNKSFTELTPTLMGTQKKVDSQVYLLRNNFSLLEVLSIQVNNQTDTRKAKHTFDAMIELPEGYEDNDFYQQFSGKTKRFICNFVSSNPNNRWEVRWFSSVIQNLTPGNSYSQILQLPTEPVDLLIVVRKLTNNGVAEANGTISWAKDGVSYPPLAMSFNAGDDVSELVFMMPGVDATAVNPNDRINVTVNE